MAFDGLRGELRQTWFRLRYTEHLGAQLNRSGVRFAAPVFLCNFAILCLFSGYFVGAISHGDLTGGLLAGSLVLVLLLVVVTALRLLIGYFRRHHYSVVLDPEAESGLGASDTRDKFPILKRIVDGSVMAGLWVLTVIIWVIALAILYSMLVGDFVPFQTGSG
ncbi:MAG: hypothetical protein GEU89_15300 [Kiloniellaceae bacterium]|nr:hypothetical protein [Kiloniellaceae bacterium]